MNTPPVKKNSREYAAFRVASVLHFSPQTLDEIADRTGFTREQARLGLTALRREMSNNVLVCHHAGRNSTYRLAAQAEEVTEYAEQLAKTWRTQLQLTLESMDIATRLLPATKRKYCLQAAVTVRNALELLQLLMAEDAQPPTADKIIVASRERRIDYATGEVLGN
jgi:hypothetical protein